MSEIIGLNIGTHSIKLIGMKMTSKGPFLTYAGAKEISPAREGEEIGAMSQSLKTLFQESGLKENKISLTVSGQGVHFRRITMPSIPKNELREAVRWEMKGGLPYPAETAQIELRVLNEFTEEGVKKLDLIAVACPKDSIERTVSIAHGAGLKLVHLGVAPLALWNALRFWKQMEREGIIAVADLGAAKTGVYLFNNGVLQFSREVAPGGSDITQAILEGMGLDQDPDLGFQQAEKMKREMGIVIDTAAPDRSKITFLMRPVLEKMTVEIRRSLDYFRNQFHAERIDRLLLTGGGANLKNISAYLAAELRLPVEIFNPFKEIALDSRAMDIKYVEETGPFYTIAAGVALSEPQAIEFLPGKRPVLANLSPQKLGPLAAPVIAALVMLGIAWNLNGRLSAVRREHETKTAKIMTVESVQDRLILFKEKEQRMKDELSHFAPRASGSVSYGEVLREVSHLVPNTVTLKLLALQPKASPTKEESHVSEGKQLSLAGFALGHDLECITALAQIIEHLGKSSLFRNARLVSAEGSKMHHQTGVDFEIVCDIALGSEETMKP
jgi:type IV pilus assembly protein PilM